MSASKRLLLFLFTVGFCIVGLNAGLARAATVDVAVNDDGFQPNTTIKIHKGDTVRWTNTGTVAHGVTSGYRKGPIKGADGFIDSDPIAPGDSFEQTFTFHGFFGIYDKYNAAADTDVDGWVVIDDEVFISPESSTFSAFQGFDLAFHFNNDLGLQGLGQCSISFDGVELGSCGDVFTSANFRQPDGRPTLYMLTVPPHTLPAGLYSVSIQGVTSDGRAFSDTAWYRIADFGVMCGARGC